MKVEYVLVSQDIEIYRTSNYEEALKIQKESNVEWNEYVQQCVENNEYCVDNEVFLYEEKGE